MKGVPAAALAYHNPSGVLVDGGSIFSGEETPQTLRDAGTAGGWTTAGETSVNGETADGGGSNSCGRGGNSAAVTGSSRFRC